MWAAAAASTSALQREAHLGGDGGGLGGLGGGGGLHMGARLQLVRAAADAQHQDSSKPTLAVAREGQAGCKREADAINRSATLFCIMQISAALAHGTCCCQTWEVAMEAEAETGASAAAAGAGDGVAAAAACVEQWAFINS